MAMEEMNGKTLEGKPKTTKGKTPVFDLNHRSEGPGQ